MRKQRLVMAIGGLFAASALLGAGYLAGKREPAPMLANTAPSVTTANGAVQRKVLYWHDPMQPNQHFDKPGKSPFMDMQLVPVYADEAAATGIKINADLQQNLGIRYATVQRKPVSESFEAVGSTQFDESQADVVQSRVTGYIDHLYASAPMQRVKQGASIASIYVPDWLAPQEEYLALKRSHMDDTLLSAARARMRALSIPDAVISALDRTGTVQTHIVLPSPRAGVLTELNVRNGAMVAPGQTLAKVAGLSTLWVVVDIPEALAARVQPGMTVDATLASDASQHLTGRIREVLPGINPSSRTLSARLEIDNASGKLTPGMWLRVRVSGQAPVSRLLVPSEAVIATGKRTVVIVQNGDGRLAPVNVTIGEDFGGDTEIVSGLNEGQRVVASGQFLVDSEASLKSVLPAADTTPVTTPDKPASAASASAPAVAAQIYETTGKVESVTADGITFSHQPVPALGWPGMTMSFGKPSPEAFADVKPGQTAHFAFRQTDDGFQLTKVERMSGGQP
ncbi:Cation efflux system protein CusB [Pandoraea pneumonica]|uniref:Cation efflux system protein CusB n=1 Tax=Pandoraea pneumonica TaxID=2508299 RepID=A0A5E4SMA2_9BURK|nr:efflux RND transporter periplasmic adaptor subunit [Pandoraea pneumonica]VVD76525.1 Cation efflux system protein CusB [Pandoraea pneumonica]